jgi:hypothetical protein
MGFGSVHRVLKRQGEPEKISIRIFMSSGTVPINLKPEDFYRQ